MILRQIKWETVSNFCGLFRVSKLYLNIRRKKFFFQDIEPFNQQVTGQDVTTAFSTVLLIAAAKDC